MYTSDQPFELSLDGNRTLDGVVCAFNHFAESYKRLANDRPVETKYGHAHEIASQTQSPRTLVSWKTLPNECPGREPLHSLA